MSPFIRIAHPSDQSGMGVQGGCKVENANALHRSRDAVGWHGGTARHRDNVEMDAEMPSRCLDQMPSTQAKPGFGGEGHDRRQKQQIGPHDV